MTTQVPDELTVAETLAAYINCGLTVSGETSEWNGVHECVLVDTLLEMCIVQMLEDPVSFANEMQGKGILHGLAHRFIQLGIGIAVEEELYHD